VRVKKKPGKNIPANARDTKGGEMPTGNVNVSHADFREPGHKRYLTVLVPSQDGIHQRG